MVPDDIRNVGTRSKKRHIKIVVMPPPRTESIRKRTYAFDNIAHTLENSEVFCKLFKVWNRRRWTRSDSFRSVAYGLVARRVPCLRVVYSCCTTGTWKTSNKIDCMTCIYNLVYANAQNTVRLQPRSYNNSYCDNSTSSVVLSHNIVVVSSFYRYSDKTPYNITGV